MKKSINQIMKKSINNRKAEFKFLVVAILGMVSIVLVFFLVTAFYQSTKEKMEVQNCKNSISAHAFLVSTTKREIFTDIKCPTKYKTIDVKNEDKAKREIAEDMHTCWYEWNKGDAQLFKDDGIFCHICSVYDFKQKNKEVKGFMQYLATTPIKVKYVGDNLGLSYQDYFQGFSTPKSAEMFKEKEMTNPLSMQQLTDYDKIDTSKKYATIFVYASGKKTIEKYLESGGKTALGLTGAVSIALGAGAAGTGALALSGWVSGTVANIWNPIGWVSAGVLLIFGGTYVIYSAVTPEDPEWVSLIVFRQYDSSEITRLGCQELAVNQQSRRVRDGI